MRLLKVRLYIISSIDGISVAANICTWEGFFNVIRLLVKQTEVSVFTVTFSEKVQGLTLKVYHVRPLPMHSVLCIHLRRQIISTDVSSALTILRTNQCDI